MLRPIDTTMSIARAAEINKANADPQANQAQVGQFAAEFKREMAQQQQQVNNTSGAEKGSIDKDGKNSSGEKEKKKNKKEDEKGTPTINSKTGQQFFKSEKVNFEARI